MECRLRRARKWFPHNILSEVAASDREAAAQSKDPYLQ